MVYFFDYWYGGGGEGFELRGEYVDFLDVLIGEEEGCFWVSLLWGRRGGRGLLLCIVVGGRR